MRAPHHRIGAPLTIALTLALLVGVGAPCFAQPSDTIERCIAATCRIHVGGGAGSGCIYAETNEDGNEVYHVLTAAHVIASAKSVVCKFGRDEFTVRGTPRYVDRSRDIGVVAVPKQAFRGRHVQPVPLANAALTMPRGQYIFSLGCPGGGPMKFWRGAVHGYASDGGLLFTPGPELGRSGSAIFAYNADGTPVVVGILSARDTGTLTAHTVGRAVSLRMIYSRRAAPASPVRGYYMSTDTTCPCPLAGTPGACDNCPYSDRASSPLVPIPAGGHLIPYRNQVDRRLERLERVGMERSPGTFPLPPATPTPQSPQVDNAASQVQLQMMAGRLAEHDRAIADLQQNYARVREGAERLGEKYPEVAKVIDEVRRNQLRLEGQVGEAHSLARGAGEAVVGMRSGMWDMIKDKVWGVATTFGLGSGLVGVVVLIGLGLFLRKDIKDRIGPEKDPLLIERLLKVVTAATPWSFDDKVSSGLSSFLDKLGDRITDRVAAVTAKLQSKNE